MGAAKARTSISGASARPAAAKARAWVMETLPVAQERLSYAALLHAQEVFVTNSVVGVMPVSSIDGISVRMPDTGVTRTLSDRLAALP